MECLIIGMILMCFPAYVIAAGVYRRLIRAGYAKGASMGIGTVSLIASFLGICLLLAIFLSKFRLMR